MQVQNGAIVMDENGNAKGGVRNTYVDVPVAQYGVPNNADPKPGTRDDFYCGIGGFELAMSPGAAAGALQGFRDLSQQGEAAARGADQGGLVPA
jgi:hypothetical protein